ncbi:MAG: hypothetical protein PVH77_03760 [Phycisphaerales bacterium]|jgi:hypothetical protein
MDKRCSNCILPANLPGINLDGNGKCNYCREYQGNNKESDLSQDKTKERFEKIIESLRGKGKYDCLVPLSGGKDSSYILYVLVKTYNLRVLAFNFDNSFQHSQAVKNIETLVNNLGVDLIIYKPGQIIMRELFKTFLETAGEFCTPCNMLISATKFRLARQNGIRAIMSGSFKKVDPGIVGLSPALYFDRKYYFEITKKLLNKKEKYYYVVPPYPLTAFRRLIGTAPQDIDVLNYLKPSFTEMDTKLREIGWERPADAMQHGDCLLDPLKDYIMYKKWGCTELTGLCSALVRGGEMTRDEAIKEALAEEQSEPPEILPKFLKSIGLTESDFEESMEKDFRNIPNMRSTALFQLAKQIVGKVAKIRGRI